MYDEWICRRFARVRNVHVFEIQYVSSISSFSFVRTYAERYFSIHFVSVWVQYRYNEYKKKKKNAIDTKDQEN